MKIEQTQTRGIQFELRQYVETLEVTTRTKKVATPTPFHLKQLRHQHVGKGHQCKFWV